MEAAVAVLEAAPAAEALAGDGPLVDSLEDALQWVVAIDLLLADRDLRWEAPDPQCGVDCGLWADGACIPGGATMGADA